ncbi:hypothetical protein SAMN05421504_10862 [Amycolatopsis xylanica]|uniref:Terpene synthase n=1 Tax=Amycolatopsis xylanica TaxID=589385 RepID=A0A1H3P7N4_9PSEU|nr:hypothetical protein [Amycolatopsis xylanica]SDY97107.1 hypothetical protein SAMN05421504_10862 [Amycolatopsis xylanica]
MPLEIPDLDRRYPLRRSPHYEAVADEFHAWFLDQGLFTTEKQRKAFVAKDYPYLVSIAWPACDRRTLWDFATLAAALSERDDEADAARAGASLGKLRASLADVQAHQSTSSERRWGPLLAKVWRSMLEYVSPQMMTRLADAISGYLEGCIAYDLKQIDGYRFGCVEDYLEIRRFTIAQRVDQVLTEISLGIDLGQARDDKLIKDLCDRDVERVIVYHDLLSLRKDLAEGETENIVLVIAGTEGCDLQEAVHRTCRLLDKKMDRYEESARKVRLSPLGWRDDVCLFVDGLNDFTSGLIEWATCSARYTMGETSQWATKTQIVSETPCR